MRSQTCAVMAFLFAPLAFAQTTSPTQQQYRQTNLVASSTSVASDAAVIDPNLAGAWGISRSSNGPWWVANGDGGGSGTSSLYNGAGARQSLVVTVPPADPTKTPKGSPVGIVFNANPANFILPDGTAAVFLFSTLDGLIAGWNGAVPNSTAQIVVNAASTSVFTGLAVAQATVNGSTGTYLYAADARARKVAVFDSSFRHVAAIENAIASLGLPPGFGPFGIQNIGGTLYVTVAPSDQSSGPGQGGVAAITPEGRLIGLLQSGSYFNAPWGVALAPSDFGQYSHDLLVGNNGDGKINVFNPQTGQWLATLVNANNQTIEIPGLWALGFGNDQTGGGPATTLYFSAGDGPGQSGAGLFGTLTPVQNTFGSDQ